MSTELEEILASFDEAIEEDKSSYISGFVISPDDIE